MDGLAGFLTTIAAPPAGAAAGGTYSATTGLFAAEPVAATNSSFTQQLSQTSAGPAYSDAAPFLIAQAAANAGTSISESSPLVAAPDTALQSAAFAQRLSLRHLTAFSVAPQQWPAGPPAVAADIPKESGTLTAAASVGVIIADSFDARVTADTDVGSVNEATIPFASAADETSQTIPLPTVMPELTASGSSAFEQVVAPAGDEILDFDLPVETVALSVLTGDSPVFIAAIAAVEQPGPQITNTGADESHSQPGAPDVHVGSADFHRSAPLPLVDVLPRSTYPSHQQTDRATAPSAAAVPTNEGPLAFVPPSPGTESSALFPTSPVQNEPAGQQNALAAAVAQQQPNRGRRVDAVAPHRPGTDVLLPDAAHGGPASAASSSSRPSLSNDGSPDQLARPVWTEAAGSESSSQLAPTEETNTRHRMMPSDPAVVRDRFQSPPATRPLTAADPRLSLLPSGSHSEPAGTIWQQGSADSAAGSIAALHPMEQTSAGTTPVGQPAPPLTSQILTALVQQNSSVWQESADRMTLRLDPPELGQLDVEFIRSAEGISVRISAEESMTMEMLMSRSGEIERMLLNQSTEYVKVEFTSSGSDGQDPSPGFADSQQNNAGGRQAEGRQRQSFFDEQTPAGTPDQRPQLTMPRRTSSRVRLRA